MGALCIYLRQFSDLLVNCCVLVAFASIRPIWVGACENLAHLRTLGPFDYMGLSVGWAGGMVGGSRPEPAARFETPTRPVRRPKTKWFVIFILGPWRVGVLPSLRTIARNVWSCYGFLAGGSRQS